MFECLRFFILGFLCFFFSFSHLVLGQNNNLELGVLHFMSGDTLPFKEFEKTDFFISGFKQNKFTKKWVIQSYPSESLLFYKLGDEKFYFYKYKPSAGGFLSREEMEQYVKGKKDANYGYAPKKKLLKSTFLGLFLGLFDTSFDFYTRNNGWSIRNSFKGVLKSNASFLSISTPLISTFLIGKKNFNLVNRSNSDESILLEESYKYGYESVKISKDTKAVARGSLLGVGVIVILSFII